MAAVAAGADSVEAPSGDRDQAQDQPGSQLRLIAAAAFSSWIESLAERLTTAGLPPDEASDLATTLVTLLEGAHVLCRAAGSVHPFDQVACMAATLTGNDGDIRSNGK